MEQHQFGLREWADLCERKDATIAALQDTIMQMGGQAAVLAKDAMAAKEQVAALQARVQELEARQYFGACAKCLTNAWRICKEGTPDAVEMKCSNGSTWWLCDYCAMKIRLAGTYRIAQDSENERLELKAQLAQRTAELEAAKRGIDTARTRYDNLSTESYKQIAVLQAELERVRGERDHAKKMEAVQKEVADNQTWHVQKLRTLILALPKVEGEIEVCSGVYNFILLKHDSGNRFLCGQIETEQTAKAIAALLQHRQGMEG